LGGLPRDYCITSRAAMAWRFASFRVCE
jgi:hypothetical protein